MNAFSKYVDSEELTTAIHLNQGVHFQSTKLTIPPRKIAALRVFGAISEDRSEWVLRGNFLETHLGTNYEYPGLLKVERLKMGGSIPAWRAQGCLPAH